MYLFSVFLLSPLLVWQTVALFDAHATDTDPTHSELFLPFSLQLRKKYFEAAALRRASFTPLVVSVDGVLGREANFFVNHKHLAQKHTHKWEKSNSKVLGWMRA